MCYTQETAIISLIVSLIAGIYLIIDFACCRGCLQPQENSENDNRILGFGFIIFALSRIPEWFIYSHEPKDCSTEGSRLGFLILMAVQPAFIILICQRFAKRFKIDDTSIKFPDIILTAWILGYGVFIVIIAATKMKDIHHMYKNIEVSAWCVTEERCTEHQCYWQMDWNPVDRKLYPLWWMVTYLTLTLSLENWFIWTVFALILPLMVWFDDEHLIGSSYACIWGPSVAFLLAALGIPSWISSQFSDTFYEERQKRHLVHVPLY